MRICTFPGCGRKHYAKGVCWTHYQMHHVRGQELRTIYGPTNHKPPSKCKYPGCDRIAHSKGYCNFHYIRFRKYGSPDITHTRGRKSQGGHSYYPNHSLLIRNRLIKLDMTPICQVCGKKKAKFTHHIDGTNTNHTIENLLPVCSKKCHNKLHVPTGYKKWFEENGMSSVLHPSDRWLSKKEIERMFEHDQIRFLKKK